MAIVDPISGAFNFFAPNVKALGLDWPALQEIVEKIRETGEEYKALGMKVRELDATRRQAEQADINAFAAAIQAGKGDPGSKNTEKLEKELTDTRRRRQALQIVLNEFERERVALTNDRRSEWHSEVQGKREQAKNRVSEAVASLRDARANLDALNGLDEWISGPQQPFKVSGPAQANTVYVLSSSGPIHRRDDVEKALEILERESA